MKNKKLFFFNNSKFIFKDGSFFYLKLFQLNKNLLIKFEKTFLNHSAWTKFKEDNNFINKSLTKFLIKFKNDKK